MCGRLSVLESRRVLRARRTFDRDHVRVFTQIDGCPTSRIGRGGGCAWRTGHPTSLDTLYGLEEICRTCRKSLRDGFAGWGELLADFEVLDTFLEAQTDVSHHGCHPCAWVPKIEPYGRKSYSRAHKGQMQRIGRVLLTLVRQYQREVGLLHVPTPHTHSSVEILISTTGYNLELSCSRHLHQVRFKIQSRGPQR